MFDKFKKTLHTRLLYIYILHNMCNITNIVPNFYFWKINKIDQNLCFKKSSFIKNPDQSPVDFDYMIT